MRDFWKQDGDKFYCTQNDLMEAYKHSGATEDHIRWRMGRGYHLFAEALNGTRLTKYEVNHIEWGLTPEESPKPSGFTCPPRSGP